MPADPGREARLPGEVLILASQSPRRVELLRGITPDFEVIPSGAAETVELDIPPEENALRNAKAKALWVAERHPGRIVLGADTLVALDGEILGKPSDEAAARQMLRFLSGRAHRVVTGVAVTGRDGELFAEAAVSTVEFKPLTAGEISAYVQTGEPMDKAGAYAIQGQGAFMVKAHSGSFSNIVGLPVEVVKKLLPRAGWRG